MKLYSKENITASVEAMSRTGRFVHSYIITGEKGAGKKISAKYIAMQLMCDNKNACGICRQCSRVLKGQHPDFIAVEKDKKKKIYSVDTVREVCADSYIFPNDCERKVYFFPDCEGWTDASQNALLKITEDPPERAYFIFTAQNKGTFLSTLISRSMVMEVREAPRSVCAEALSEIGGYDKERIEKAVEAFGGNIGRCIDFLEGNSELMKSADAVRNICEAIVRRDEYSLAVILKSVSSDRDEMRSVLEMLARAVRDGAALRSGGRDIIGCTRSGAVKMAEKISAKRLLAMYDSICEASLSCTRNCNAAAAAAVLAGRLAE